jgi:hypothetical protein
MPKFVHADVLDGGLNAIKNGATKMLLIKAYAFGDSYATVVANKLAEVTMTSADYALGTSGNNRTLTNATKSATSTAATSAEVTGTATSGSTTALNDTGKAWTTNEHANKIVTITAGTGVGQSAKVTSNTTTGLVFPAMGVALDATSVYRIDDDLHLAHTDGSAKVLWVTDETSNVAVASGATTNFSAVTYTNNQPT